MTQPLYMKLRKDLPQSSPPELVMAIADAIRLGLGLKEALEQRGLTIWAQGADWIDRDKITELIVKYQAKLP